MPTEMTEEEVARELPRATLLSSGGYQNPNEDQMDDYVTADLYQTAEGRQFRHVTQSGFDSPLSGAGDIGEWLTDEEAANWTDWGQDPDWSTS
jgi:hypothetical protein